MQDEISNPYAPPLADVQHSHESSVQTGAVWRQVASHCLGFSVAYALSAALIYGASIADAVSGLIGFGKITCVFQMFASMGHALIFSMPILLLSRCFRISTVVWLFVGALCGAAFVAALTYLPQQTVEYAFRCTPLGAARPYFTIISAMFFAAMPSLLIGVCMAAVCKFLQTFDAAKIRRGTNR